MTRHFRGFQVDFDDFFGNYSYKCLLNIRKVMYNVQLVNNKATPEGLPKEEEKRNG